MPEKLQYDEKGRRIVRLPTAIFLDLDRCAYNTTKGFDIAVEATAYTTPITARQMYDAYEESRGRSFNVVGWVNATLDQMGGGYSWQHDVAKEFIARGRREQLLMPGTSKLLDYAEENEIHLGIMTYGASTPDHEAQTWKDADAWQRSKAQSELSLAKLAIEVCDQKRKGRVIANWRRGDEIWLPDSLTVEEGTQTVVERGILVDDKTDSFRGLDELTDGVRVTPEDTANQIEYQKGELPVDVVAVHGMTEALGALKTILTLRRH